MRTDPRSQPHLRSLIRHMVSNSERERLHSSVSIPAHNVEIASHAGEHTLPDQFVQCCVTRGKHTRVRLLKSHKLAESCSSGELKTPVLRYLALLSLVGAHSQPMGKGQQPSVHDQTEQHQVPPMCLADVNNSATAPCLTQGPTPTTWSWSPP